ncbi:peptidase C65 Otubain-domain-containing protein [Pisolithus marmoratus]|nr:peptidase C65 Otubain-domain-containing protein [Pisolithus marmoratus]
MRVDALQRHFEESIPSQQPLMSEPVPISALRVEYENGSSSFVAQIDDLVRQGFTSIIRTRGDGDCFYRSLAFAYIDQLIRSEEPELAVATALSSFESQKRVLQDANFDEIVYDLPYGVFTDLIKRIVSPSGDRLTSAGLLETFRDSEGTQTPQYIVMYLRLLTSAQIRTAPDEFEAFIMHPDTGMEMTVTAFCELFVDPMGKEADHVQIAALSRALRVRIQIAYLDGRSSDGKVEFVEFNHEPDSIYRPGHYDIIDKNDV